VKVAPGARFACWFFGNAEIDDELGDDTPIADDVYISRRLDVDVKSRWREWLGSLAMDEVEKGGLVLYVTAPASSEAALEARRDDVLNGLLLQGVPYHQTAMALVGANLDGRVEVSRVSRSKRLESVHGADDFRLRRSTFERAARLGGRLRAIQGPVMNGPWARLFRAVRVLLDANSASNKHGERFHQLVRVLDGVVKTRQRSGERDFAHRAQTFAIAGQDTWATLMEIYRVRGAVEHLKSPTDAVVVTAVTDEARRERINRLTRQADVLARFVVCRILEHDPLFTIFETDAGIDGFWALRDHERAAICGERIDIRKIR
jgi:hypothetical protein